MDTKNQKNWTILFYLNGNNELAPEMAESKKRIDEKGSDKIVNVLVQYGSAEKRIVEIIRPQSNFSEYAGESAGVCRYHAAADGPSTPEYLGNINMADPKRLYDFIRWGMENYPAKHYILVLGGHVFQYVGLMPDYCQDKPFLMGYPEMVNSLSLVHKDLGRKIDLLVLDTCYANRIEMLYELGKEKEPPVERLITYISGGPIAGLHYGNLLSIVMEYSKSFPNKMACKVVSNLNYDLIAYEINHIKLDVIKKNYSDLALCYMNNRPDTPFSPLQLLKCFDHGLPWHPILENLTAIMPSLTLCYNNPSNQPFGHFYVSAQNIPDPYRISLYNRLSFARNNGWTKLLCNTPGNSCNSGTDPYILQPSELYALVSVMNPGLNSDENCRIVQNLISYKGWTWQ
ncbi:MAG TPA: clostripain-related cysteine peptidase [Clostridia bacterium]|nr:clostripain-related cysteine peptidase [Clostridia bacterium]